MQHARTSCQLQHVHTPDSCTKIPSTGGIPCHDNTLTTTRIPNAQQWIDTTTGRLATDPTSWMQAVHWAAGSGIYTPTSAHSPLWGTTTVRIAQELKALSECRPGIDYLAKKLGVSERTVQYHLALLREAGLLVYRTKGTRRRSGGNVASHFERVIPVAFDEALGIRTKVLRDDDAWVQRVPVGIAEQGRKLIGKLARKAARKVRRRPAQNRVLKQERCTPMSVAQPVSSSTSTSNLFPSESKLSASGKKSSPTPKQQKARRRTMNTVGRRYQLARQLIQQVPWLGRASVARIAWIVRGVADAGWSVDEVRALVDSYGPVARVVHRPSGFLANRLTGHALWCTDYRRAQLVTQWRDNSRATARRHDEWQAPVTGPQNPGIRAYVQRTFNQIKHQQLAADNVLLDDSDLDIESLTRDQVISMRAAAEANPALIDAALALMDERDVRRLYTNRLVDQSQKTYTGYTSISPWQEATYA